MQHTFLFEEAIWKATGLFVDETGGETEWTGETQVTHCQDCWENRGKMRLSGPAPMELENSYRIEPFNGKDHTTWTSFNPALGTLTGLFAVVGDSILSLYRTENGSHQGTEYLVKLDEDRYLNRGALFQGEKKVSSWVVELIRQK